MIDGFFFCFHIIVSWKFPNRSIRRDYNSYCRMFLDKYLPDDVDRVLYLDSDDYLVPTAIASLMEMQGKTHADIVLCNFYYTFPDYEYPAPAWQQAAIPLMQMARS